MKTESTLPVLRDIESWLTNRIAQLVNVPGDTISPDMNFESFGIDSARAVDLMFELEEWLGLSDELPLELLFEAASIAEAAQDIQAAISSSRGDQKTFASWK